MAIDDLWYLTKRDADDNRIPSKRHGRGKRYRVRVDSPDGNTPTKSFHKLSDAKRYDNNIHADISRGLYIDPVAGKISLRDYSEQWRTQQIHIDTTEDKVERAFRLHVWPLLGETPMDVIRRSHIQSWVKDRSAEGVLAASSLHIVYGYLSTMFKSAVLDRIIGVSPCQGITLPKIPDADRYIPTPVEVHAVVAELPVYYRAAVWVAAGCGLRPQEVFGLELTHVDWLRRELRVRQQVRQPTGETRAVGRLKTKTSKRDVDLPAQVQEELARLVALKPPQTRRMRDLTDPRKPFERDTQLLFTTARDRPVNRSNWSRVWRAALRRADAKARAADPKSPGVTQGWGLHSLRHFFATSLIHKGASVKTVQLALGHSKPSITLDTYTHEWPDVTERTRTLMEDALRLDPGDTPGSTSARS